MSVSANGTFAVRYQDPMSTIHCQLDRIVRTRARARFGPKFSLFRETTMMQLRQSAFACTSRLYPRSTVRESEAAAAAERSRRRERESERENAPS